MKKNVVILSTPRHQKMYNETKVWKGYSRPNGTEIYGRERAPSQSTNQVLNQESAIMKYCQIKLCKKNRTVGVCADYNKFCIWHMYGPGRETL